MVVLASAAFKPPERGRHAGGMPFIWQYHLKLHASLLSTVL